MSPSADVVWLSPAPDTDPMGEFDAETRTRTGPVDTRAVNRAAGLLQPVPVAPLPSAPPPAPATAAAPVNAAVSVSAVEPVAATRVLQGRWFVWMAVLALLALVQTPFVVLWALQAVNGPVPIALQVAKPAPVFTSAPPVPVERTLVPPPRPSRPAAPPVPAGSLSGFVRMDMAVPMRIPEDGRLLGTRRSIG